MQQLRFDLLRVRTDSTGGEQLPEEHLLNRIRVFLMRECAPVLTLRQRPPAGQTLECAFVEAALPANALEQRRFARLQPAPQKLPQDRRFADQWKSQRSDQLIDVARAIEYVIRNHACVEYAELQLGRKDHAVAADDQLPDRTRHRLAVTAFECSVDRRHTAPGQHIVRDDEIDQRTQVARGVAERGGGHEEHSRAGGTARQRVIALCADS